MGLRWRWWLGAVMVLATGCAQLPPLAAGECGNGVVEPGEDCDVASGATGCVPAGQAGQCRYRCAAASEAAAEVACPGGWSCGQDGLCRVGQGQFLPVSGALDSGAGTPQMADFDGDGVPDLLTLGEPDLQGRGSARVLFLGRDGLAQSSLTLPLSIGRPAVGDITRDERADLVFPHDLGPSVLVGQRDRSLSPLVYPLLSSPAAPGLVGRGAAARFRSLALDPAWCATYQGQLGRGAPLCQQLEALSPEVKATLGKLVTLQPSSRVVVLLQTGDARVSLRADSRQELFDSGSPQLSDCQSEQARDSSATDLSEEALFEVNPPDIGLLARLPQVLVGGADLTTLGGMCDRVFVPLIGQREVKILRPCAEGNAELPSERLSVDWRHRPKAGSMLLPVETVTVEPGLQVDGRLLLAHVDGDGFLDLLVGVRQGPGAALHYLVARGSFDGAFAAKSGGPLRLDQDRLPFKLLGERNASGAEGSRCATGFVENCLEVDPPECFCEGQSGPILATGDFDGDQVVDLVTPEGIHASTELGTVLGVGFTHLLLPSFGSLPNPGSYVNSLRSWGEAVVGDFNADGRLDLAAAPGVGAGLEVLFGTPEGTFNRVSLPTDAPASQLAVGDIDGDQVPDLVFKEDGPRPSASGQLATPDGLDPLVLGDALSVVRGRRDGLLAPPESMGRLGFIDQLIVAPLSSSSRLRGPDQVHDVAVAARSLDQDSVQFSLLYGEAGGLPLSSYGIDNTSDTCNLLPVPLGTVASDLDADTTADLAVLALDDIVDEGNQVLPPTPARLWAVHGAGKGRFDHRTFSGRIDPNLVLLQVDRAVEPLNSSDPDDDSGGFFLGARFAHGDLDGDGREEVLVLAPARAGACYDDQLVALVPELDPGSGLPEDVRLAARDQVRSLLEVFCRSGLVVARPRLGPAGRTVLELDPTVILPLGTLAAGLLQLIDLDGDGFRDVLFTAGTPWAASVEAQLGLSPAVARRSELYVLWNDGGALQTTPTRLLAPVATVRSLVPLNLDADAEPELIVQADDRVWVLDRTSARTFGERVLGGIAPGALTAGDVNGDGLPDLLVNRDAQTFLYTALPRAPGEGR